MGRNRATEQELQAGRALGRAIGDARRKVEITQLDLARRARVDLDSLRGIERGRFSNPSFFSIMRIARALGISGDSLFAHVSSDAKGRKSHDK